MTAFPLGGRKPDVMRRITGALALALVVICSLLTGVPATAEPARAPGVAAAASASPQSFDLATYLASSPIFEEGEVDLSGVRGAITGYTVLSESYVPTGMLAYKEGSFPNNSDTDQVQGTSLRTESATVQTAYTVGHTFTAGASFTWENKVTAGPVTSGWTVNVFFNYAAKIENQWTSSQTSTITLPSQSVRVPPHSLITVKEWYEQGRYDAQVQLDLAVSGSIRYTACGQTVTAPIGAVLAHASELGLPPLPSWVIPTGDSVTVQSEMTYMSTPAVKQVVETSAPSALPTRIVGMQEPVLGTTIGQQVGTRSATTKSAPSASAAPSWFSSPPRCHPVTVDGSAILLPDGRIIDPEHGTEVPGPSGVRFAAVSGARWKGIGTFLSAIDTDGNAYWFSRGGSFSKFTLPTEITKTADGVALLGADGNVYDAGNGRRISAPSGTRFVDVSGVHHYGDAFYFSAIGRDGKAYWSERGDTFTRLNLPVRALDTIDGTVILGEGGRLFLARTGQEIQNPDGMTPASVSGTVDWGGGRGGGRWDEWGDDDGRFSRGYNSLVTVVDSRSGIWISINGSPLEYRRWDGGITRDGLVGVTHNGYAFGTLYETDNAPSNPPGTLIESISAGPDWLTYHAVSAVTTDGRVFWSNDGSAFREVNY